MFTQIPNYPDYEINEKGWVRRILTGRILKTSTNTGYTFVSVRNPSGIYRNVAIHRLMMMAFKPVEDASKLSVNHLNGIRSDNRLENLEWCTRSENARLPKHKPNKGVYHFPLGKKNFRVAIRIKGKQKTFGYYSTAEEAASVYRDLHKLVYSTYPDDLIFTVESLKSQSA